MKHFFRLLLSFGLSILVSACSTVVKQSDKDPEGRYDGLWRLEVTETASEQRAPGYLMRCRPLDLAINIEIQDSILSLPLHSKGDQFKAFLALVESPVYVGKKGNFEFVLKSKGGHYTTDNHDQLDIFFLFRGSVINSAANTGEGKLTLASEKLLNKGCVSKFILSKKQ